MRTVVACAFILAALVAQRPARAQWPTLHKDYQRSGHTDEVVAGPYQRKWFRSFVDEMIGPRCEAIVAEKLCFVGTYAGNLYALDIADGRTVWQVRLPGPIGHSPCWRDGRVYVCSDDGHDAGTLACLRAGDGGELWRYRAAAGFWNSPACDGRLVYVGDRGGVFHAVDAQTGRPAWTFDAGAMVLKPASFSPDGQQIVFGAENMRVYCLSPQGRLLWKSLRLAGLSLRDAAPTIWAGRAVVRTNPSRAFHETLYDARRLLAELQRALPLDPAEDKVVLDTQNQFCLRRTARRERAEYEGILKHLAAHPHDRTWFTFDLGDGREPWTASVLYTAGLHNPPTPPTFHHDSGELYTIMPTSLGVYCDGVSQTGIGIGRIDPQSGYLVNLSHAEGDRVPGYWAGMTMITDETSSLSLMGDFLVCTHQGAVGGVDLGSRKLRKLFGQRDSYGGLFGPGLAAGSWEGSRRLAREGFVQNALNEWHGPDRAVVAISDRRMFWVAGGCVVCFAGPNVPAAASGGDRPPEPWKWQRPPRLDGGNLTSAWGGFDAAMAKTPLGVDEVRACLAEPPQVRSADDPLSRDLRRRLEAAIAELRDGPWAPWIVQLGISGEERHFVRSAETMQTVALALPHLPPAARAQAVEYLDGLFASGVPLRRPSWEATGKRREPHELAPEVLARVARAAPPAAELADLYALWAYAHYADRWEKVLGQGDAIRGRLAEALDRPLAFRPDGLGGNAVEWLNGQLAGTLAAARIMARAGRAADTERAWQRLAELATERVHFERADGRLQSRREHHARIPRYLGLTPETASLLARHAGQPLRANLADLDRQLPVWHHAWGERLIGGENYISPPHLARALFLASAYGLRPPPADQARRLDHPWCRADLYCIEKLTALLSAARN